MTRVSILLSIGLLAASVGRAESAAISLRGIWVHHSAAELYLATSDAGRWVRVGEQWGGLMVESFDAAKDTIFVRDRTGRHRLVLVGSKIDHSESSADHLRREIITDNLYRLTLSACQHLLEQQQLSVRAADLVGGEQVVHRLEPAGDETYDDVLFQIGRRGVEISVAGEAMLTTSWSRPIVIQVQPTQSLSAISAHLKIPLEILCRLNPSLSATENFKTVEAVRLN